MKKSSIILLLLFTVIIAGCGSEKITSKYKNAVLNHEPENLVSLLETDDNEITKTEANAHIDLINAEFTENELESELNRIQTHLDDDNDSNAFLNGNGGEYVLFSKENNTSTVSAEKHEVSASLEEADLKFDIDGETVDIEQTNSDYDKIYDLIPGIYHFQGTGNINNTEFDMVMDIDFSLIGDEKITINDEMIILNITEHFPKDIENIKYFANESEITDLNFDDKKFGPINGEETVKVYATGDIEGNELSTEAVSLPAKDTSRISNVNLNFDIEEIEEIRESFKASKRESNENDRQIAGTKRVIEDFYKRNLISALEVTDVSLKESLINFNFEDKQIPEVINNILLMDSDNDYELEISELKLVDQNELNQLFTYDVQFVLNSYEENHRVEVKVTDGGTFKIKNITDK